jgi:exopolyphosphatase/guanosine-5'-triphosphate,3'-diphosphate pyrophosphatase
MLIAPGFQDKRRSGPKQRAGVDAAEIIAAVDLGSNSFHMKVARVVDGQLAVIDRMRDSVRLAAGLDESEKLSGKVCRRSLVTLERFGQRLRNIPPDNVRTVGTSTLRRARNSEAFLADAQAALGHPIEVISGREEARLIYLGVAHSSAQDTGRRLVVDIGGGSTELIIGQQFDALRTESLDMGCVGTSREFFPDGAIDARRMRKAEMAARQELEGVEESYRRLGWDSAIGASGTVRNVWQVLHDQAWSRKGITAKGVKKLREALIQAGHAERLDLRGLQPARAPVFAGGVAILSAIFDALGVKTMSCSDGALREGLLYDLIGRLGHQDVREATIDNLARRYRAEEDQAQRVAASAGFLLGRVADAWDLGEQRYTHLLEWAARLHEIGLDIAHSEYHRHGAYILRNADLPGFSRQEQAEVAALVHVHRRKFDLHQFDDLPRNHRSRLLTLAILLRIAVVLHRGRLDVDLAGVHVEAGESWLRLEFARKWLSEHPLTEADLTREKAYLKAAGVELNIS